jgi:hypothetical protein
MSSSDVTLNVGEWLSTREDLPQFSSLHVLPFVQQKLSVSTRVDVLLGITDGVVELYARQDGQDKESMAQAVTWMRLPIQVRDLFKSADVLCCSPRPPYTWYRGILSCWPLRLASLLGGSSSSVVFSVTHLLLNKLFGFRDLVAKFSVSSSDGSDVTDASLQREAKYLQVLSGVDGDIPVLIGLVEWKSMHVLVCTGAGVAATALLEHSEEGKFPLSTVREIARGVVRVLRAIHLAGIAHMDISPANIVQRDGRWSLGDFASCLELGLPIPSNHPLTYDFASDKARFRTCSVCEDMDYEALIWSLVFLLAPSGWRQVKNEPTNESRQLVADVQSMVDSFRHEM